MVLFVTGRCTRDCWYCPISTERRGRDAVYANDRLVESADDILEEARVMSALGTGITGGDPMIVPERVEIYCTLLKETFGKDHHIHLYTGKALQDEELLCLQGLVDEIRLHPPQEEWPTIMESAYPETIATARKLGFSIGIEVPSLPGLAYFIPLLPLLDFLNINELEWSETNAPMMRERGLELAENWHNAVAGAKEWARDLLGSPKVRWCSSTFKDSVQLRERLKRIARNTAREFDEITGDGTIVYGVWEPVGPVNLPPSCECCKDRIEMAWEVLAEHPERFPGKRYIIERYPNGGMVVEVIPL
ncbi:MAG: radical SAM protein [Methanomicrobiaceae archaeon]|nr:radical SAM protein [Methanomicrobiaceae archaeon]